MHTAMDPMTTTASWRGGPRARLRVRGEGGQMEIDVDGQRFAGVLRSEHFLVSAGDALTLRLVSLVDDCTPIALVDPLDVRARVAEMDGADMFGASQLLADGVSMDVTVEDPIPRSPPTVADFGPPIVGTSIDEALTGLVDLLEPTDDDDFDLVTGSLRRMPLSELVQGMGLSRKTATIKLRTPLGTGTVHVEQGEVTFASFGDLMGQDAFVRLIAMERGSFRVHFGAHPPKKNIAASTQFLILDALRRQDEEQAHAALAMATADDCVLCDEDGPCVEHAPARPKMVPRVPTS